MTQHSSATADLTQHALRGDAEAFASLVGYFSGDMRRTIHATLAKSRHWNRSVGPDDVSDVLQDVVLMLLERGPKWLAGWEPSLGLSLVGSFRWTACRAARSYLRSGRRSRWAEIASDDEVLARSGREHDTEAALAARDELRRWWATRPSDQARNILLALYVEQLPVDEICARWSLSPNAVYCATRRSRSDKKSLAGGVSVQVEMRGRS
jgi:RNA polymerase sigma factor (sigma-70 family)